MRLIDGLNNTVVSSLADASVGTASAAGACAGGETTASLSRGAASMTLNVAGYAGSAVTTTLTVQSQLIAASAAFASLRSGPVRFVVGNCTAGTGRSSVAVAPIVVGDTCSVASELVCSSCGFGTYSLASNNAPCTVLSSANAAHGQPRVCVAGVLGACRQRHSDGGCVCVCPRHVHGRLHRTEWHQRRQLCSVWRALCSRHRCGCCLGDVWSSHWVLQWSCGVHHWLWRLHVRCMR